VTRWNVRRTAITTASPAKPFAALSMSTFRPPLECNWMRGLVAQQVPPGHGKDLQILTFCLRIHMAS
jgi:hypothetical protein